MIYTSQKSTQVMFESTDVLTQRFKSISILQQLIGLVPYGAVRRMAASQIEGGPSQTGRSAPSMGELATGGRIVLVVDVRY
jgi:hypothetical protein